MARKINAKVAKEFADECKKVAEQILSSWGTHSCYWDSSEYAVRQFVLLSMHSWGTAYCNWDKNTERKLVSALRKAGATNIKIVMSWDDVYCTFDMKVAEQERREKVNG